MVKIHDYSDQNNDCKYMLNVIDTFSMYAWLRPLKKNGINVSRVFKDIIKDIIKIGHKSPNVYILIKG